MKSPFDNRSLVASLGYAIGLAAALASAGAAGTVYRWVDENGVTVYSQTAPPQAPTTVVKPDATPDPQEIERARDRLREEIEADMDRREDERAAAEKAQKAEEDAAARKARCETARKNLDTLRDLGARRLTMPDGQPRRLSEEEKAKQMELARKTIEESCN